MNSERHDLDPEDGGAGDEQHLEPRVRAEALVEVAAASGQDRANDAEGEVSGQGKAGDGEPPTIPRASADRVQWRSHAIASATVVASEAHRAGRHVRRALKIGKFELR